MVNSKNSSLDREIKGRKLYLKKVINALHTEADDFKKSLQKNSPYETLLYAWINRLYIKGKNYEDALQVIYRARVFIT